MNPATPVRASPDSAIVAIRIAAPAIASTRFIPGPASATRTMSRRGLRNRA